MKCTDCKLLQRPQELARLSTPTLLHSAVHMLRTAAQCTTNLVLHLQAQCCKLLNISCCVYNSLCRWVPTHRQYREVVLTSSSSSNKESGAFVMDLLVGRDVDLDFTGLLDENKSCANQRNVTLPSKAIHLRTLKGSFMFFLMKKDV